MPIYEYRCTCGHEKEVIILSPEESAQRVWCDQCGGTMDRVMSQPAVVYEFKSRDDAHV